MNESLRRALLRARLSEEDVAARLQVDPKTVRRWLEGRVPYPRHRWPLAAMLGLDEADLWPQLGASRSRPQEIQAIYPHREDHTSRDAGSVYSVGPKNRSTSLPVAHSSSPPTHR